MLIISIYNRSLIEPLHRGPLPPSFLVLLLHSLTPLSARSDWTTGLVPAHTERAHTHTEGEALSNKIIGGEKRPAMNSNNCIKINEHGV